MNLKSIVQRIYDKIDYNPDVAEYKDGVVRRVADYYEEVNADLPWLFLQKTYALQPKATVEGSSTATVSIGTGAGNRRLVTGTGTSFADYYDGMTFTGPDGADYPIGMVTSATAMYLTTPYASGVVTNSPTWSVSFPRWPLPADCTDVLSIVDNENDRGKLAWVDRDRAERDYYDVDTTGAPRFAIEDDHVVDRPPPTPPGLANGSTAGSNLNAATEYEYCYTFLYNGRESPPSSTAKITTLATATEEVVISGMEDSSWTDGATPNLATSRLKNIYRRNATDNGPWYLVKARLGSSTTTHTDTRVIPGTGTSGDIETIPILLEQGPRRYVRLWFTNNSNTEKLTVRYLFRPPRLTADSDAPVWPVPYHHLLVFLVMDDMWSTHGNLQEAEHWRARAKELKRRMRARCLASEDRQWRRRSFRNQLLRDQTNWGTPSIS